MTNYHGKKLAVILAAGGSSRRFGGKSKLFAALDGMPLFIKTLRAFADELHEAEIVIAAPCDEQELFGNAVAEAELKNKNIRILCGGNSRTFSVWNALSSLDNNLIEFAAVHDAARPFASAELFKGCLEAASEYGAAIVARPLTDTLKKSGTDRMIEKTIDRAALWTVETPQIFRLEPLKKAYRLAIDSGLEFTDDAAVTEYAGQRVFLFENTSFNLKITYPQDLRLAEAFIRSAQ